MQNSIYIRPLILFALGFILLVLCCCAAAVVYHRLRALSDRERRAIDTLSTLRKTEAEPNLKRWQLLLEQSRNQALPLTPALRELWSQLEQEHLPPPKKLQPLLEAIHTSALRELKRSQSLTDNLGQDLLQVGLLLIPFLIVALLITLRFVVFAPLRRAGRAQSAGLAAAEIRGLSTSLADLFQNLDAQQKIQAYELLQAGHLAALGTLAASTAHEIRNPLMAISGTTESLLRDQNFIEPQAQTQLMRILQASDQANRCLKDMLSLCPAELEKSQRFDLSIETREAVRMAGARDSLPAEYQEEIANSLIIQGRPTAWRQMVFNLVINALDALSKVESPKQFQVRLFRDSHEVVLRISNSGLPIEPELEPRLFDPFISTKGSQGTGLGLFICAELARQEHAAIRYFSTTEKENSQPLTHFEIRIQKDL